MFIWAANISYKIVIKPLNVDSFALRIKCSRRIIEYRFSLSIFFKRNIFIATTGQIYITSRHFIPDVTILLQIVISKRLYILNFI